MHRVIGEILDVGADLVFAVSQRPRTVQFGLASATFLNSHKPGVPNIMGQLKLLSPFYNHNTTFKLTKKIYLNILLIAAGKFISLEL
jgi:hypothetical protein